MHALSRWRRATTPFLVSAAVLACAAAGLPACGSRTGIEVLPFEVADAATRDAPADVVPDVLADVFVPPPPPVLDCADAGLTYVYVISQNNDLYSFYPSAGTFTRIGAIECNDPEGTSPFSMAVDHQGVAYVVFSSGFLYRVSTKTAACTPTTFVPGQLGYTTFGMGFVATPLDGGGTGESLFVSPDPPAMGGPTASILASIDLTTFTLREVAPLGSAGGIPVRLAELTGTGGGNLYGFFAPTNSLPPSYIVGLDTRTAQVTSTVQLPNVVEGSGWAFGFWGGDFYTFTSPTGQQSVVTRYRPSDGSVTQVAVAPPGVLVVGAGVSTCAPQQ
jgi:hypothetical protein